MTIIQTYTGEEYISVLIWNLKCFLITFGNADFSVITQLLTNMKPIEHSQLLNSGTWGTLSMTHPPPHLIFFQMEGWENTLWAGDS